MSLDYHLYFVLKSFKKVTDVVYALKTYSDPNFVSSYTVLKINLNEFQK